MTGNDCEKYDYQSATKQLKNGIQAWPDFLLSKLICIQSQFNQNKIFLLPLDLNIYPKMPREWDPVTRFENLETLFDNDLNLAMIVIMRLISNDELWRSKSSTNIEFVHSAT